MMNALMWILAALLAAAFLAAGLMKVTQPKAKLAEAGMGWTEDVSERSVKLIGAVEVLGAVGLVVPAVLGIAVILTPLAALGLALVMAGATVVHVRRGEMSLVPVNLVLLVLAAVVAWGRFGPYAF
ncbi:DoxX family protein [Streptomyces sp. NPDC002667]|uniref:DoxX family protein n=1 Tax=Streptomyces sp. NPDC002667 TaxID=3364657 RepID=UPI00369F5A9B